MADANEAVHYDQVIYNKYPYPGHYFSNIELHRDNNKLFLETDSVCTNIPDSDMEIMRNEVQEYNLQDDQSNCKLLSDKVIIKSFYQFFTKENFD